MQTSAFSHFFHGELVTYSCTVPLHDEVLSSSSMLFYPYYKTKSVDQKTVTSNTVERCLQRKRIRGEWRLYLPRKKCSEPVLYKGQSCKSTSRHCSFYATSKPHMCRSSFPRHILHVLSNRSNTPLQGAHRLRQTAKQWSLRNKRQQKLRSISL